MLAQIIYTVSLVIIIPTAAKYVSSLGQGSPVFFGLVVGISSIIDPVVSRAWSYILKGTSLSAVLIINVSINLVSCVAYSLAAISPAGATILLASRCVLGLGSVQTAYLQYLGCAVSTKRRRFAHFLTTAAISYGFAFGIFLALLLSLVPATWDERTLPGWFSAALWLLYLLLHMCFFVEPNKHAGILDADVQGIQLGHKMKPVLRREPFNGLLPCFLAIIAVAVVTSAFEVMTIGITQSLWQWDVMKSACFLGGIMLLVSLTTLLAYPLTKWLGEGNAFVIGLCLATTLVPFFYFPVSVSVHHVHEKMDTSTGMGIYLAVSILALSSLNLGRTIAFTLATELPSPQWRDFFLSTGSQIFTMGRGIGPVVAGALASSASNSASASAASAASASTSVKVVVRNMTGLLVASTSLQQQAQVQTKSSAAYHHQYSHQATTVTVLLLLCASATLAVLHAHLRGYLRHKEHELGPARAESLELDADNCGASSYETGLGATVEEPLQLHLPSSLLSRPGKDEEAELANHSLGQPLGRRSSSFPRAITTPIPCPDHPAHARSISSHTSGASGMGVIRLGGTRQQNPMLHGVTGTNIGTTAAGVGVANQP